MKTSNYSNVKVRRPETIELWIELTGKKLFWWEPVSSETERIISYVVCDDLGTEHLVRQNGTAIESIEIQTKGNA